MDKASAVNSIPELTGVDGYVNTRPGLFIKDLIGQKVILIDFWTFSCINCQRTLYYLNEWYRKYKHLGLMIIGVHTPEFSFEKDYDAVVSAANRYGIEYPVVLDNEYATWHRFDNQYWPHKYLIDATGRIVYDHVGEGNYEETEAKIIEALIDLHLRQGDQDVSIPGNFVPSPPGEPEYEKIVSPEIYFGALRSSHLGNGMPQIVGRQFLELPRGFKMNILYLDGVWSFTNEYAENNNPHAKIVFRYGARDVYLVAGALDEPVPVVVTRDGKPLAAEKGEDVEVSDGTSKFLVGGKRLYKLIHDPMGYGEHTIELITEKTGLQAYTFTFG